MNSKILRVFLSVLLVSVCVLPGFSSKVAASEGQEITFEDGITARILLDNSEKKIVETKDEYNIYRATFDKESQEITVDTYDHDGNLLEEENLTEKYKQQESVQNQALTGSGDLIASNGLGDSKKSFGYWVYDGSPGDIWVLKLRPGVSKNPTENSENTKNLIKYKESVDSFASYKNELVYKVGSGMIITIATLYLVPEPTWSKILATLLTLVSSTIAYAEGRGMYDSYMDAKFYFHRVDM